MIRQELYTKPRKGIIIPSESKMKAFQTKMILFDSKGKKKKIYIYIYTRVVLKFWVQLYFSV